MVARLWHAQSFYFDLKLTDPECQFKMRTKIRLISKGVSEMGPRVSIGKMEIHLEACR